MDCLISHKFLACYSCQNHDLFALFLSPRATFFPAETGNKQSHAIEIVLHDLACRCIWGKSSDGRDLLIKWREAVSGWDPSTATLQMWLSNGFNPNPCRSTLLRLPWPENCAVGQRIGSVQPNIAAKGKILMEDEKCPPRCSIIAIFSQLCKHCSEYFLLNLRQNLSF